MSKRTFSILMIVIFSVFPMLFGISAYASENTESPQLNTVETETLAVSTFDMTAASSTAMTQPTTEEIIPADFPALTVNAVSNFFPNATAEYNVKTKQVEVTYYFKSSLDLLSVQWYLTYDQTVLSLSEENNTPLTVCPVIGSNGVLSLDDGYAHFCSSNVKLFDFSKDEMPFARFLFDVNELSDEVPEIITVDLTVDMLVVSETDAKTKKSQPELELVLVANEGLSLQDISDVRLSRKTALTESNFVQATTAPPTTVQPVTDANGKVINTPDEPKESTPASEPRTASPDATSSTKKPSSPDSPATVDHTGDKPDKDSDKGVVSTGAPFFAFICLGVLCVATSALFVMRKKEILYN